MAVRTAILGLTLSAALAGPAESTTIIDTTPLGGYIGPFGEPNTATYGQTFLAPLTDPVLTSFSFWLNDFGGPDTIDFAAYLFAWDSSGNKATGPMLYQSTPQTTSNLATDEMFTFNPGGVPLVPGGFYVAFLSASQFFDGIEGAGYMPVGATGIFGNFVYSNNGGDFASLTTTNWDGFFPFDDAAFKATFVSAVPEPAGLVLLALGMTALRRRRRCWPGAKK